MSNNHFKDIGAFYNRKKEKEIELLEHKKQQYEAEIKKQEYTLISKKSLEERLKYENMMLKDKYNSLKRVIKERGLVIEINNDNYYVKEWDNLSISKEGNSFIIFSKKGEKIKELDIYTSGVLEEIIREQGRYSLVVTRVDSKHIKMLLRLG